MYIYIYMYMYIYICMYTHRHTLLYTYTEAGGVNHQLQEIGGSPPPRAKVLSVSPGRAIAAKFQAPWGSPGIQKWLVYSGKSHDLEDLKGYPYDSGNHHMASYKHIISWLYNVIYIYIHIHTYIYIYIYTHTWGYQTYIDPNDSCYKLMIPTVRTANFPFSGTSSSANNSVHVRGSSHAGQEVACSWLVVPCLRTKTWLMMMMMMMMMMMTDWCWGRGRRRGQGTVKTHRIQHDAVIVLQGGHPLQDEVTGACWPFCSGTIQ